MSIRETVIVVFVSLAVIAAVPAAQSPITTVSLGPDQIGLVKTAQGITTRISFVETVNEIVCGDLYDPSSGKGSFVVQRSGYDVFLKPIASRAFSNLFVKTGEKGEHVYAFDLMVVAPLEAHRVINVIDGSRGSTGGGQRSDPGRKSSPEDPRAPESAATFVSDAQRHAEEILARAREQAGRIVTEAENRAAESDREASQRADQEIEQRFIRALMLGLRDVKINTPRVSTKKLAIMFDQHMVTLGGKSYVRYTIQNTGESDLTYARFSLEATMGDRTQAIPAHAVQTKNENRLRPNESVTVILVFDSRLVGPKTRLTLYVRGEGNAEIARVNIQ